VLDSPERANQIIFTEKGRYLLEQKYDRIFVMCDRRIVDVAQEYGLSQTVAAKLIYAGYVAEPISLQVQERARAERGVGATDKWVVCSGGGGHLAEELIRQAGRLVSQYPNVYFDLVLGPRSALPLPEFTGAERRVRIVKEDPLLPVLHAASDIVICPGGYNSLMEVAVGRASVVVAPIRDDWEQREHARRLAKFLPVTLVEDSSQLSITLQRLLEHPTRLAQTSELDLSGAAHISQWISDDLSVAAPPNLMEGSSARRKSKAKVRARG
jgi:predicted glycosyltransferase